MQSTAKASEASFSQLFDMPFEKDGKLAHKDL